MVAGGEEIREVERREKKNPPKSKPAEMPISAETPRNSPKQLKYLEISQNLIRGGMGGCLVPVCIPVRDFLSVLAGTEQNIQL